MGFYLNKEPHLLFSLYFNFSFKPLVRIHQITDMVTATENSYIPEESHQNMENSGLYHDLYKEYDVIDRVAHLPVVNSTLTAVHDYYTKMKKDYPKFAPYFQAAENITYSAAILALRSSKPVVDKFGPTINAYANTGLDKLEGSIPLIKKHPSEVIEEYVDYYLPCDDADDDTSSTDGDRKDASVQTDEEKKQSDAKERINIISHKVKQRSYGKAMQSWSGIRTRSEEALNKLNFTVDLVSYLSERVTL